MSKKVIIFIILILAVGLVWYAMAVNTTKDPVNGENNGIVVTECFAGGCSGEICSSDPEVASTCELLPGMECIGGGMVCQAVEGDCTWILDRESAECFMAVLEEFPDARNTRIGHLFDKAEELLEN